MGFSGRLLFEFLATIVLQCFSNDEEEERECQISKEPAGLDIATFRHKYLGQRPVILKGGAVPWLINEKPWSKEEFAARYGNYTLPMRDSSLLPYDGAFAPIVKHWRIGEYVDSLADQAAPIFENQRTQLGNRMRRDFSPHQLPFSDVRMTPIVSVGKKETGISLHQHDQNWLAQFAGRKLWFLHPPTKERPETREDSCSYQKKQPADHKLQKCVIHSGDILYLPDQWWHATCNLDPWTLGYGGEGLVPADWPPGIAAVVDGDIQGLHHAVATGGLGPSSGVAMDDIPGFTAYHFAAMAGDPSVLDSLRDLGIKMEQHRATSNDQRVADHPLHLAAMTGQVATAAWFIDQGTNINLKNHEYQTALHIACYRGASEVAQFLIEKGANVKSFDKYGRNALHWCAQSGREDIIRLWIDMNLAGLRAKDGRFESPADVARKAGKQGAFNLLVNYKGKHDREL